MSKALVDLPAIEALVAPVCSAQGVELVCVQFAVEQGGPVLRVLIELPNAETLPKGTGGVTLESCTRVSREVSPLLDEKADHLLPPAYRLEVSSPGIERPLVGARDFERYAGREVKVSVKTPILQRKTFTGKLLGLRDQQVALQIEHEEELVLPIQDIAKAHLVFRF